MSKKTLLQINTTVNTGSHGKIAEEIGCMATDKGWNSYIAYGRKEGKSHSVALRTGSWPDVAFHGLQTRLFDKHGLASAKATKRLIRKIEHIRPDIIHLHNLHGYYLHYAILFDYLSSKSTPVIWTLHDCWPFTGHCAFFSQFGCDKWETHCHSCPQLKQYPASLWMDRSGKNFFKKQQHINPLNNLTLVAVSDWLAELVSRSFLGRHPIRTIKNGTDTRVFTPSASHPLVTDRWCSSDFIILGAANTWDERKGLRDIIELSGQLNGNEHIVLVGLNKRQRRQLPPNITGMKHTNNKQELAALYARADLFINTSREESLGMTTIEALACGTPALVYHTTALPEVVSEDTGCIVEKEDVAGLKNAVLSIKNKGKPSFTKACRSRALQFFNQESCFEQYFQLYHSTLQQ